MCFHDKAGGHLSFQITGMPLKRKTRNSSKSLFAKEMQETSSTTLVDEGLFTSRCNPTLPWWSKKRLGYYHYDELQEYLQDNEFVQNG